MVSYLGGSDGKKALIRNRKVVFVLIDVMTHSCTPSLWEMGTACGAVICVFSSEGSHCPL